MIKHLVISSIFCGIYLYMVGAFIAADFDFAQWTAEGRGYLAFLWIVTVGVCASLRGEL